MKDDFNLICRRYGEDMAYFCKENFSVLLEKEGLLPSLLLEHFGLSRELYHYLRENSLCNDFIQYIYSFTNEKKNNQEENNNIFNMPHYVMANGKLYAYNYIVDDFYFCPDNIFITPNRVVSFDKERYLLFDYFLLDLKKKKLKNITGYFDSFVKTVGDIKNIEIECENENKIIKIENNLGHKQEIKVNKNNQMIFYCNHGIKEIRNNFCFLNETLEELILPNVEKIGDCFCYYNNSIKVIEFPRVKYIGRSFFQENEVIEKLDLSSAIIIGAGFCMYNKMLKIFKAPNLLSIDSGALYYNNSLIIVDLPKVEFIGSSFCYSNEILNIFETPNLLEIGHEVFYNHKVLHEKMLAFENTQQDKQKLILKNTD